MMIISTTAALLYLTIVRLQQKEPPFAKDVKRFFFLELSHHQKKKPEILGPEIEFIKIVSSTPPSQNYAQNYYYTWY